MRSKHTAPFDLKLQEKVKSVRFAQVFQAEFSRFILAHRIVELREKRGLSQANLARLVGYPVWDCPAGESQLP